MSWFLVFVRFLLVSFHRHCVYAKGNESWRCRVYKVFLASGIRPNTVRDSGKCTIFWRDTGFHPATREARFVKISARDAVMEQETVFGMREVRDAGLSWKKEQNAGLGLLFQILMLRASRECNRGLFQSSFYQAIVTSSDSISKPPVCID